MINKSGKVLVGVYVVCLVVLFLMCSTDLIIREPEREIYQIAVIIEDVRSDNYGNFRKGMDQGAAEFNADIQLITLYEKLDAIEQMELMDRHAAGLPESSSVSPISALPPPAPRSMRRHRPAVPGPSTPSALWHPVFHTG